MPDLSQAIQDRDGNASSKRLVLIGASLLFAVGYLADLFTSHHPTQYMVDDLMIVILGALGFTAAEWFGKPKA